MEVLRGIKRTVEEADHALDKLFQVNLPIPKTNIDQILIASNSATKKRLLTEAVRPFGIEVVSPDPNNKIPEEDYQKILREINTPGEKYAPRLSARKLTNFLDQINPKLPAIAFDTVVLNDQGQVIEKPKSMSEAKEMITNLTNKGNSISVIDGVTFVSQVNSDQLYIHRTSVVLAVLLNEVNETHIKDYIDEQGIKVLDIAGGIDFASEIGEKFIEREGEVSFCIGLGSSGEIKKLSGTIDDLSPLGTGVLIGYNVKEILNPYFRGIPTHLVRGLIRNIVD